MGKEQMTDGKYIFSDWFTVSDPAIKDFVRFFIYRIANIIFVINF